MALGLARFFGIRLPQNFDSPLRASSIIDFWLRWHMTLTRFLTAYIYNPLALSLTRRRLAKGLSGFGGRNTTVGSFVYSLMFPTIVTMFLSGLWHGAGYGFIVWGVLHGLFLSVNHAWRVIAARLWSDKRNYDRFMTPAGVVLTLIAVTSAMIFFRSPTMGSAIDMVKGLIGLNGVGLPENLLTRLGSLGQRLHAAGVVAESMSVQDFSKTLIWTLFLMFIALACPNTLQLLSHYEPALGVTAQTAKFPFSKVQWAPSLAWAIAVSVVGAIAIISIGGPSEFLYWQF
jgi:hypothetical protein